MVKLSIDPQQLQLQFKRGSLIKGDSQTANCGQILIPVVILAGAAPRRCQSMFNSLAPVSVRVGVCESQCVCLCVWVNISCELLHMLMFFPPSSTFSWILIFLCFSPSLPSPTFSWYTAPQAIWPSARAGQH